MLRSEVALVGSNNPLATTGLVLLYYNSTGKGLIS